MEEPPKDPEYEIDQGKEARQALRESHERLLTVLDSLDAIVYVADIKTHELIFVNKYTRDIFGDVEGKLCWQAIQTGQTGPCDFCTNDRLLDAEGKPAGVYVWEFRNTANGRWYHIRDKAIPWIGGRIVRLEIATDITERKESEEDLKESLHEKEVLLREVHHRVKNNMTVISSLLRLQSSKIRDEEYKKMFDESINRIRSMTLIHEKLYRTENLAKINFTHYLNDMIENIFSSYTIAGDKVRLKKDIDDVTLSIDTSIPCGLIVNELVSNCLKHAFPGGREGKINIVLHLKGENEIELTVSDNGVGMPQDLDIHNTDSLGMNLITGLAGQLQGKLELNRESGTAFRLIFPLED